MHNVQRLCGLLKERCSSALRQEQGLAFAVADARVIEIDDDRGVAGLLLIADAEEERAAAKRRRDIAGGPFAFTQEQILAAVEPENRDRLKAAVGILAEQDGIFALELLELTRHDQRLIDRHISGGALDHAQVLVIDIVERHPSGHQRPPLLTAKHMGNRHGTFRSSPQEETPPTKGWSAAFPVLAATFLPWRR